MTNELADESRAYELLTQAVYRAILSREGETIEVKHNVDLPGRSGVKHQCDVYWKFRQAGVEHVVVVECKHYARPISLGNVRDFASVLDDLGVARGIMVTRSGFQSGAADFAEHRGISAKVLRPPQDSDWDGRVQKVEIDAALKWFDETDNPMKVHMDVAAGTEAAHTRLATLHGEGRLNFPTDMRTRLCNANGEPATEEFGWWLPNHINIMDKEPGGPYTDEIDVAGLHVGLAIDGVVEYWPLKTLKVTYFVRNLIERKIVIDAADTVQAVLQDFLTGEVEHFHSRS